ncbi:MAG TPA: hypothetical protein VKF32_11250 [Thermoanaerobaculia bacterium]|nr:hypothetical protein [Thermoanaerobaculia bacterium]
MKSGRLASAVAALAAAALLLASPRAAAQGKFDLAVATDNKEAISQHDTFPQSTARIYVVYKVTLPKAGRVKSAWMAEKVEGEKENSKFSENGSNLQPGTFMGVFSNGRPGSAWPAGTYRVDLYVDDKLEKSVRFRVVK